MNVLLPPDLEEYVESLVKNGEYPASNDVIADALRQHQVSNRATKIPMTPELEKLLDEGMEDPDQAVTTDQLRRRWSERY